MQHQGKAGELLLHMCTGVAQTYINQIQNKDISADCDASSGICTVAIQDFPIQLQTALHGGRLRVGAKSNPGLRCVSTVITHAAHGLLHLRAPKTQASRAMQEIPRRIPRALL